MPNWNRLSQDILSLFLHPNCPLCGRSAKAVFCRNCECQLYQCQLSPPQFQGKGGISVVAWGQYGGLLKRAIAALKYEQQSQIARALGSYLGQTWLTVTPRATAFPPTVVPIPLHPDKQKQRGYNQAELIARAFCAVTGLPWQPQGLTRIKNTQALFNLTPQAREAAIAQAFRVGKGLKTGQSVLILDDIYTTGTTARAAQITLEQVGIKVIGIAAIATSQPSRVVLFDP